MWMACRGYPHACSREEVWDPQMCADKPQVRQEDERLPAWLR